MIRRNRLGRPGWVLELPGWARQEPRSYLRGRHQCQPVLRRRIVEVLKILRTGLMEKQGAVELDSQCGGKLKCETAQENAKKDEFPWWKTLRSGGG